MLYLLERLVVFIEDFLVLGIVKILRDQVHVVEAEIFRLDREELKLLRVSRDDVAEVETVFDPRASQKRRRQQADEKGDDHDLRLRLLQHFAAVPAGEPRQRKPTVAVLEINLILGIFAAAF